MNTNERLKEAIEKLRNGGYTLVLTYKDETYTSNERGVKPLLSLIEAYGELPGSFAADKVVGKAAAFLYLKLGVRELYADVISTAALRLLRSSQVSVTYSEVVEAIRNRAGDGFCPMESAVLNVSDINIAVSEIYATLKRLNSQKS